MHGQQNIKTTVFVSYLLGWHVSATVDHPQVTKMCNEEKLYSVRTLVVVHFLNFQWGLVTRFIYIELIICSTGKVDRDKVHIHIHFTCRTYYSFNIDKPHDNETSLKVGLQFMLAGLLYLLLFRIVFGWLGRTVFLGTLIYLLVWWIGLRLI